MKKKITLLMLIAVVMSTGIFATPIEVNISNRVVSSFNEKFSEARNISWSKSDGYIKAGFTIDNQCMVAYFTETGEFMGVTRNLLSTQLPITLNASLKKVAENGWITELFEFSDGEETTYFCIVENAHQKIQLKSLGSGSWMINKRVKKG